MIFAIVILSAILWFYFVGVYFPKWRTRRIERRFVIPYLEKKGFQYLKILRIPFAIPKDKGDFNDEVIVNPFYDTRFNRKTYYYVFYIDNEGYEFRMTIKVSHNFNGLPISVQFYNL